MQIHLIHPGQPIADFAISGTTVTVAGVDVDCAARQQDVSVLVEIRQHNGAAVEGDQGAYLAQIQIPARRYSVTPVEHDTVGEQTGENPDGAPGAPGMQGPSEIREPLPLDPNAVIVTLWPAH